METKKELGQLITEKLEQADFAPKNLSWGKIESTLKKRRRKRFLWISLGTFVLIITSSILVKEILLTKNIINPKSEIVEIESLIEEKKENTNGKQSNQQRDDKIVESENHYNTNRLFELSEETKDVLNPKSNKKASYGLQSDNKGNHFETNNKDAVKSQIAEFRSNHHTVAEQLSKNPIRSKEESHKESTNGKDSINTSHFLKKRSREDAIKNTQTQKKQNPQTAPIDSLIKTNQSKSGNAEIEKLSSANVKRIDSLGKKDSISENSLKKPFLETKTDTTQIDSLNSTFIKKWNISIQAAPIYSRYLSNKSPLLQQNVPSEANFNISLAYRLLVNVPVNDNILFRFGIGQLDFRDTSVFDAISGGNSFVGLTITNIRQAVNPLPTQLFNDLEAGNKIQLEHHIRYLQFPIEGVFALSKRKLHIGVIAGMDVLVLQSDEILLASENQSQFLIGNANYLNSFSFSGHLGLGIAYPLSEHIKLELEPTFIYQLNGYNGAADSPHPAYFGIYSGISFRF